MREDRGAHIPFLFIDTTRNCCNVTEFWCAQRAFVQSTSKSVMRDKSFFERMKHCHYLKVLKTNNELWNEAWGKTSRSATDIPSFRCSQKPEDWLLFAFGRLIFCLSFAKAKKRGNSESSKSISNHNWITVMKFSSRSMDNSSGKGAGVY